MNSTEDSTPPSGRDGPSAHVDWARLNDLLDARLTRKDSHAVELHLAECDRCRALREAVRALSADAASLASELPPPDDLWGDIATSIGRLQSASTVGTSGSPPSVPHARPGQPPKATPSLHPWSTAPRWLTAAALALMALSSGLTALYLRNAGNAGHDIAAAPSASDAAAQTGVLPAAFAETERTYLTSVAEVEALLNAQRGALAPETIAIVDRALATIDAAIAEARAALLADPANRALTELLETSYRQKLDLLRRTAGLS
jgi:hypothetical protein